MSGLAPRARRRTTEPSARADDPVRAPDLLRTKVLTGTQSCSLKLYSVLTEEKYITAPRLRIPVSERDSL